MAENKSLVNELVSYILKNLKKGYTRESLKWALINQGYSKLEVEKALKIADQKLAAQAPTLKSKPEIKFEIVEPKEYAMKFSSSEKPWWKRLLGL